ncbi:MbtH family protein [Serratia sp. NPDC078593]|uniref:MbtH family protein n=1 Tax=unclassified Serratia (in: enterobacteria) TaxID=2647522 RepID=UPI0037D709F2
METLNPFDDPQQRCLILRNDQQQYSLWPDFSAVPPGWVTVFGPAERAQCVSWLEENWQDMRPASQRQA